MKRPQRVRGLCRACWGRQVTPFRTQYKFTAEMTAALRAAYKLRGKAKSAAIADLERKTGWPRATFSREARRLNIAIVQPIWSKEEDAYLLANIGEISRRAIARTLGRSIHGVSWRAQQLDMSTRIRAGYCLNELMEILGASRPTLMRWIRENLLGPLDATDNGHRISDESLTAFIRQNGALIDFRMADQTFLKGVLFGEGGLFG
jgi:hypothetical protein